MDTINMAGHVLLIGEAVVALLFAFVLRLEEIEKLVPLTKLRRAMVVGGVIGIGAIGFLVGVGVAAFAGHGLFRIASGHWAAANEPIKEPISLLMVVVPTFVTIAVAWWIFPRLLRAASNTKG